MYINVNKEFPRDRVLLFHTRKTTSLASNITVYLDLSFQLQSDNVVRISADVFPLS